MDRHTVITRLEASLRETLAAFETHPAELTRT
jgi:hypothetical protein